MKNKLIITVLLMCFGFYSQAQSSSHIKLYDLSVYQMPEDTSVLSSDSIQFKIQFKITKPENASKIHCLLGRHSNDGSVVTIHPVVIHNANGDFIVSGNSTVKIENNAASFFLKIHKNQLWNFSTATLYAEDQNARVTSRLFYKK